MRVLILFIFLISRGEGKTPRELLQLADSPEHELISPYGPPETALFLSGSKQHIQNFEAWLDQIKKTEEGHRLIRGLTESPHPIVITHSPDAIYSSGLSKTVGFGVFKRRGKPGKGASTVIEFHAELKHEGSHLVPSEKKDWIPFRAIANFFHELSHAYNNAYGLNLPGGVERKAINHTNRFRLEMGDLEKRSWPLRKVSESHPGRFRCEVKAGRLLLGGLLLTQNKQTNAKEVLNYVTLDSEARDSCSFTQIQSCQIVDQGQGPMKLILKGIMLEESHSKKVLEQRLRALILNGVCLKEEAPFPLVLLLPFPLPPQALPQLG